MKRNSTTRRARLGKVIGLCMACGWMACGSMAASMVGCVEGRSSTHELEHVVPAHWPASLTDAADKIESRLNVIETNSSDASQARTELLEIVSWLPEVAAETAMREPDWNSIHVACQSIETLMKQNEYQRATDELRRLSVRLREIGF